MSSSQRPFETGIGRHRPRITFSSHQVTSLIVREPHLRAPTSGRLERLAYEPLRGVYQVCHRRSLYTIRRSDCDLALQRGLRSRHGISAALHTNDAVRRAEVLG